MGAEELQREARPYWVTVWGAKGGVGTSTFALNLATYHGSLGRRVLLLDLDGNGGGLTLLGGAPPPRPLPLSNESLAALHATLSEAIARDEEAVGNDRVPPPGIAIRPSMGPGPAEQCERAHEMASCCVYLEPRTWVARLVPGPETELAAVRDFVASLAVDVVVADLGSWMTPVHRALVLAADRSLGICTPEPLAIARFFERIRELARGQLLSLGVDAEEAEAVSKLSTAGADGPKHWFAQLASRRGRLAHELRRFFEAHLSYFVLSQVRTRAEAELAGQLSSVGRAAQGIRLTCVGSFDFDDVVRASSIACQPLLLANPVSRASKQFERIARATLPLKSGAMAARLFSIPAPPMLQATRETLYDVLELSPEASEDEIRRAHRRLSRAFDASCLAGTGAWVPGERQRCLLRLDEALHVLSNEALREAYDLSVRPPSVRRANRASSRPPEAPRSEVPAEAAPQESVSTDGVPTEALGGALLRQLRLARGLEISDISERTRIRPAFLAAIEAETRDELPPRVYAAGFIRQYASYLGLDGAEVSRVLIQRLFGEERVAPEVVAAFP